VIIIDEFRAIIDDLPDGAAGLLRIASQGRSLGMHLILATQRVSGAVSPEIRANVTARLALRVVESTDSHDLVGTPAAALLESVPGRAVLRCGSEPPIAFQVASSECRASSVPSLIHGVVSPSKRETVKITVRREPGSTNKRANRLWLPPLPSAVGLEHLEAKQHRHGVPVALGDFPEIPSQQPLTWDPSHGHLALVCNNQSFSAPALVAIGVAAANAGHQVHLLAENLADEVLHAHPGFGTVASLSEPALAGLLLRRLSDENSRKGSKNLKPMVLLVQNLAKWKELPGMEALLAIASSQMSLAFSCRTKVELKTIDKTSVQIQLIPSDPVDAALAGIPAQYRSVGRIQGRALWNSSSEPLEQNRLCQMAFATNNSISPKSKVNEQAPLRLASLVNDTRQDRLLIEPGSTNKVIIGLGGDNAQPLAIKSTSGVLIAGPPGSGRTNALAVVLRQLPQSAVVLGTAKLLKQVCEANSHKHYSLAGIPWQELISCPPGSLVIDDYDQLSGISPVDTESLVSAVQANGGQVVVTIKTFNATVSTRGLINEMRHRRVGLVLNPCERGSEEIFGLGIPPPFNPPRPGSGWLLDGDDIFRIQVAKYG
jgi:S-DNA-T family DNA segregation ATPase FtsK/SpoIIIE